MDSQPTTPAGGQNARDDRPPTARVFISHISEEADVAGKIEAALLEDFHGVLEVFLSSNPEGIKAGDNWLASLESELRASAVLLILCSRESIARPWVNFESGAAWLAGKRLIPVCHKGLAPADLPFPFSTLQSVSTIDNEGLRKLYDAIARELGWPRPPRLGEQALELLESRPRQGRRWRHADLTREAGGGLATGGPQGYALGSKKHVLYRGGGRIYKLSWDGVWHHNDVTEAVSPPPAAGDPFAYEFAQTQHIVYRDDAGNLHELWMEGRGWRHSSLTGTTNAPPAFGDPVGHAHGDAQHVIYRGERGGLHELWWKDGRWSHTDLTETGGAPEAAGSPFGYSRGLTQRVVYRGTDNHIHELWWDGYWHHDDLTKLSHSHPHEAVGDPTAYVLGGRQLVVYRSADGHVHELWWT